MSPIIENMEEMKLQLVLGRKLNGEQLIQDLTKLSHLLISGQCGYDRTGAELLQYPGDFIWPFGLEFEFAHAPLESMVQLNIISC